MSVNICRHKACSFLNNILTNPVIPHILNTFKIGATTNCKGHQEEKNRRNELSWIFLFFAKKNFNQTVHLFT